MISQSLHEPLHEVCVKMLKQWNQNVLKEWLEVYCLLLREMLRMNTAS